MLEKSGRNVVLQDLNIQHRVLVAERSSSAMVGTIMAWLATLDEAGILPPEGTAQANQVIHALIQLQSTVMKSRSSAFAAYWVAAEADWENHYEEQRTGLKREEGLTERVLTVLICYDQKHPLWEESNVASALQAFNVSRADWELVAELYKQAEAVFREQGRSIQMAYKNWRMKMPGGKL